MERHRVAPAPLPVVRRQLGRVLVGEAAALLRLGAAGNLSEDAERAAAAPPPSRSTASMSATSDVKRFTSSNGGGWLKTSCVGNRALMGLVYRFARRKTRYQALTNSPAQACGWALGSCPRRETLPIQTPLMTNAAAKVEALHFPHRHLLTVEGLGAAEINFLLDLADKAADDNRQAGKRRDLLRGRTLINLFFEASTRTQSSFEMAAKRLGADVMNMNVSTSSVQKGETLIDTAMTLNAMRPDIIVVRHHAAGAVELLAQKIDCSVINAGDGSHQHPTQALLDALTIRRAKGRIAGLTVAICGDILHSRVARSNIIVLNTLGARVRIAAPSTLAAGGARAPRRRGVHRHVEGGRRRRRRHDAAPAARAHGGLVRALDARVLPLLRPRPGEAGARQARRHRHASRAR